MTKITKAPAFMTDSGQATRYTLDNGTIRADICDFGALILTLLVPDRDGRLADVVLGYDGYEGYRERVTFFGAAVGRCCNRIGKGHFTLNGKQYQLACNDHGVNHLHGGNSGLDQKLWSGEVVQGKTGDELRLTTFMADGEESYPGRLDVTLTVSLTEDNGLSLHYEAVCDADTICNLTNHSFFNLAGHDSGDMLGQKLRLFAGSYTETDDALIPTGRILPVEGTPLDFRTFHTIGERIAKTAYGGYDNNYVIDAHDGLFVCAQACDEASGRFMECLTTCPCVQLYTANGLDASGGKGGAHYGNHAGFCLETQYAPDAVNHPEWTWTSPILRAGSRYDQTTVYRFKNDLCVGEDMAGAFFVNKDGEKND